MELIFTDVELDLLFDQLIVHVGRLHVGAVHPELNDRALYFRSQTSDGWRVRYIGMVMSSYVPVDRCFPHVRLDHHLNRAPTVVAIRTVKLDALIFFGRPTPLDHPGLPKEEIGVH